MIMINASDLTRDSKRRERIKVTLKSTCLLVDAVNMRRLSGLLYLLLFYFLLYSMMKCIGCRKEFNNQGYPSHKKSCKQFKRAMRERLNNIPDYGAGPSNSNEEMVIESAGCPADLGTILLDDVQVIFLSLK